MPFKKIKLTRGKYTIVDSDDYDYLNQWKWYVQVHRNKYYYAMRRNGDKRMRMHRVVNDTPKGMDTDHINHNTLDNRKSNLRTVTGSQNQMNRVLHKNNTSGHMGVSWYKNTQQWVSHIAKDKIKYTLGYFDNIEDAIRARKVAEMEMFI